MSRNLKLQGISATIPSLDVTWDASAGVLSGPDADLLIAHVQAQLEEGGVVANPYPSFYEINDPLHDSKDMALVLSMKWVLPDDLAKLLPQDQDDELNTIAGSDGFDIPIELIH